MRKRRWQAPVAVLLTALLAAGALAACGDDDDDSGSSDEAAEGTGGLLFTLTAGSGTVEPVEGQDETFTLTLSELAPRITAFTDRPVRNADTETVADFVDQWPGRGFDDDPPNAALVLDEEPADSDTAVYEIEDPQYDEAAGTLTYTATHIEDGGAALPEHENDEPPSEFGAAHLFVDPSAPSNPVPLSVNVTAKLGGRVTLVFDSPWQVILGDADNSIEVISEGVGGGVAFSSQVSVTSTGAIGFSVAGGSGPVTGTIQIPSGASANYQLDDGPTVPMKNGKFSIPVK